MRNRNAFIPLCFVLGFVAAFGLIACGSDDDGGGMGPGGDDPNQNMMLSVIDEAVYPIVRDLSVGPYLELLMKRHSSSDAMQCQLLVNCTSGSAQYCPTDTGFTVEFDGCQATGSVLDGTITLVGGPMQGGGSLELTVDGVPLSGSVSYLVDVETNCIGQSFDQVATKVGTTDLLISGYMEYCTPPTMVGDTIVPRYADFFIELPQSGRYVVFGVTSEPAGFVEVSLWDPRLDTEQQLLGLCHGTIFGTLSCSE